MLGAKTAYRTPLSSDNTLRRGLYAIIDVDTLGSRDPLSFADRVLSAGALFAVQFRAKSLSARAILPIARSIAQRCARAKVPFFLNDRPDLALLSKAVGVHVGQTDLSAADVRRIAPALAVGVSTHTTHQAMTALQDRPGYLALGPIFPTSSKFNPDPVVGIDGLIDVVRLAKSTPVVAIGGITLERALLIREAGAAAGAVIAALATVHDDSLTEQARVLHKTLGGE